MPNAKNVELSDAERALRLNSVKEAMEAHIERHCDELRGLSTAELVAKLKAIFADFVPPISVTSVQPMIIADRVLSGVNVSFVLTETQETAQVYVRLVD